MFSNALIGLFAAAGAGAWLYSKLYRRTGGNNGQAIMFAGIGAGIVWLLVIIVLGMIF